MGRRPARSSFRRGMDGTLAAIRGDFLGGQLTTT